MFESTGVLAIDIHSHYNHGARHDTEADMKLYNPTLGYLQKVYDNLGIAAACCSTFAGVLSTEDVAEENEYAFQQAREISWLYQWVVIEPRSDETFQQAYKMLKTEKCVGIKLHPQVYPIICVNLKLVQKRAKYLLGRKAGNRHSALTAS